jgi:UDP-N-acetyl-alpha-D-muramoyl-L-alanyl-L-glutamate epimerase
MRYREFVFIGYRYEPGPAALSLHYRFRDGPQFEERLFFDFPTRALSAPEREALDRLFRLVFLLSGVSYYKAFVPPSVMCEAFPLDFGTAAFLSRFYEQGLGEFAYRNRLSLRGKVHFHAAETQPAASLRLDLPRRSCVPVGGGKDSVVTLECLKAAGEPMVLFALGEATPIDDCIARAGVPFIRVRRRLDPELFALNEAGALNGHVPITGILSAIALAAALLYGCDAVVMSNEHSASAANLVVDGMPVNHQYSKSLDFERDLAAYLGDRVSPDIGYFSLLRPLPEVEIARRFARHRSYFDAFRSCNAAFRQATAARARHWCGNCPKCRFVFLALAPFVTKGDLVSVFGRDLLDDASQAGGFAELCGLAAHKPFECVGETGESAAALAHLAGLAEWREDVVVRQLGRPIAATDPPPLAALLAGRHPHRVPPRFLEMLDACG